MLRKTAATAFGLLLLTAPVLVAAQPAGGAAGAAQPGRGGAAAGGRRAAGPPATPAVKTPTAAPAGAYRLDSNHVAVVARLGHGNGISVSVFRFDGVKGTMNWDPVNPSAIKISVTVDPASINTNVKGFAAEITGDRFLNAAKFPEITFVSTAFHPVGTTHATVDGNLTFMGQTRPATINVDLVGIGRAPVGRLSIGYSGTLKFKRSEFGFTVLMGDISDDVEIMLDGEFLQAPPPPAAPAQ